MRKKTKKEKEEVTDGQSGHSKVEFKFDAEGSRTLADHPYESSLVCGRIMTLLSLWLLRRHSCVLPFLLLFLLSALNAHQGCF